MRPQPGGWVAVVSLWFLACTGRVTPPAGPSPLEPKAHLSATGPASPPAAAGPAADAATVQPDQDGSVDEEVPRRFRGDDVQAYRWVKFTSTDRGLEIELDGGTHFVATASPFRTGSGWGVRVRLAARGATQKISTTMHGPMNITGVVERGGVSSSFHDVREGDGVALLWREPLSFVRDWPTSSRYAALT